MTESLAAFRRRMMAARRRYGPTSTIGRFCSNAIEQRENMERATPKQLEHLTSTHAKTLQRIESSDYLS